MCSRVCSLCVCGGRRLRSNENTKHSRCSYVRVRGATFGKCAVDCAHIYTRIFVVCVFGRAFERRAVRRRTLMDSCTKHASSERARNVEHIRSQTMQRQSAASIRAAFDSGAAALEAVRIITFIYPHSVGVRAAERRRLRITRARTMNCFGATAMASCCCGAGTAVLHVIMIIIIFA